MARPKTYYSIAERSPDITLRNVRVNRHYVYVIRDAQLGYVLYVGKGKGERVLIVRDWQTGQTVDIALDIDIYYCKDERDALRQEYKAIRALKPRWNVQYNRAPDFHSDVPRLVSAK